MSNPETKKLYRIKLRGMQHNTTSVSYGISYVVAFDTNEAYRKVRNFLEREDIGFSIDRELESIELLAEDYIYTSTPSMLFL